MNDPTKRFLLQKVEELCDLHPDLRFGQIVDHLAVIADDRPIVDLNDEELLRTLDQHLAELTNSAHHVA